jgi:hypothetical protein
MKDSIRSEFEKRGVTVVEVEMVRKNPQEVIGLVKLQIPLIGEVTKSCSATMTEGSRYFWQCQ